MSSRSKRRVVRQRVHDRERNAVRPTPSVRRKTQSRRQVSVKKVSRKTRIQQKSRKSISRQQNRHVRERQTNWDEIAKSRTLKKRMGQRVRKSGTAKVGRVQAPSRVKKESIRPKSRKKVTLRNNAHSVQKNRTGSKRLTRPSTAKRHSGSSVRVQTRRRQSNTNAPKENFLVRKLSQLKLMSLLGEGSFSRVYLATKKNRTQNNAKAIALKVTPLKKEIGSVISEGKVLSELKHPMIVGCHGAFRDKGYYCIVLDLTLGGELLFHFERAKHGRFNWKTTQFYCAQLLSVLDYLHGNNWIYRDLKPENILLDKTGNVKLVDFGFAKKLVGKQQCFTLCGSKEYVAPEVLSGTGYTQSADMWSLGVLLYEISVGHLPYDTESANPKQLRTLISNSRISFPPFVSTPAKEIISKMLAVDTKKRINVKQAMRHRSMHNVDWKRVHLLQYAAPIVPSLKHGRDTSNYETARFDAEHQVHSSSFKYVDSLLQAHF